MNDMFNRPTTTRPTVPAPADFKSGTGLPTVAIPPCDTTAATSATQAAGPLAGAATNPTPAVSPQGQAPVANAAPDVPRTAPALSPSDGTPNEVTGSPSGTSEVTPTERPSVPRATTPGQALRFRLGMTKDERGRYAEDTKRRGSRARPSPTIAKYEEDLRELIELKAVIKVVFQDLIESDPDALEEFGKDGYRAFNARLSRELK